MASVICPFTTTGISTKNSFPSPGYISGFTHERMPSFPQFAGSFMRFLAVSRNEGFTNSSVSDMTNLAGFESPRLDFTRILRIPFLASGETVISNSTVSAIGSEETFLRYTDASAAASLSIISLSALTNFLKYACPPSSNFFISSTTSGCFFTNSSSNLFLSPK